MIIYSDKIYALLERYLHIFERKSAHRKQEHQQKYDTIIFGFKKGGAEFARSFNRLDKSFIVVDYDPDVIDEVERRGYDYIYGDASDPEMLEECGVSSAKLVVSTITNQDITQFLVNTVFATNPKSIIIVSADSAENATKLYELGATYVMMPHAIGTEKISSFIAKHGLKKTEFKAFRDKHLLYLASYIDELPEKHSRKLGHAVIEKIAELRSIKSASE